MGNNQKLRQIELSPLMRVDLQSREDDEHPATETFLLLLFPSPIDGTARSKGLLVLNSTIVD